MGKKISIIMGIYNCADVLPEAIDSILAQTYQNWQMIMCEDGSSDQTYAVAEEYCKKYPEKFILVKNEHNMGLNYTLNRCLELADGEYIARMDGDDISLPTRFEKEVAFLEEHPEYAIVSCPMILFDQEGDWGAGSAIEIPKIRDFAFHAPFHCHAPCMIRREAYLAVGGYTVEKKYLRFEDCNLWYKLYAAGYRGYNLQEHLYKMRDDKNAAIRRTASGRMRAVRVQFLGFRMVHMPLRYYPVLAAEFLKQVVAIMIPSKLYSYIHKRRVGAK